MPPLQALQAWAARELQAIDCSRSVEPLLDFVPHTTPRWSRPTWLAPYADLLERAPGGGLRVVVAAPPQHGKTEISIHAFAWWLKKNPELRNAYATYAQSRSDRVARKARNIADRAGVPVSGPIRSWTTPGGGAVVWTSVGGPLTGEPVDGVLLVDDPYKDRKHAESPAYAEQVLDWLDDVAETRVHPGASIIVMATRWAPKDLSGVLIKRGWQYLNIKAIADGRDQPLGDTRLPGVALCPERKPITELLRLQKVNPFSFASLFQGEPRPRGGTLFNAPHKYTVLPTRGLQFGYGTDLSYSGKTSSDWSVCVRMAREATDELTEKGKRKYRYYILKVIRRQCKAPDWGKILKATQDEPGYKGTAWWRAAGTEQGTADLMRSNGVRLTLLPIKGDKFTHAQPFAEAWNEGLVMVPADDPEWLEPYVDEIEAFIGKDGQQDDQVDASVAAFDGLQQGQATFDSRYDDYLPGMRI